MAQKAIFNGDRVSVEVGAQGRREEALLKKGALQDAVFTSAILSSIEELAMREFAQLVVFRLDAQRYAVPLNVVERIVRAAEITPLPNSPGIVLGAIDVAGRVLPVLNIRRRFGLPEREICPADQFLIAPTAQRTVVLVVDEAQGVIERSSTEVIGAAQIVPGLDHIQGVVRLDGGLVLIHNLEKFFSLDEARALDEALNAEATHGN